MKNWILRASTLAFAAGLIGTLACGGSSSGCGGTNVNSSSSAPSLSMSCGRGTYLLNNQCVPLPAGTSAPATKTVSN